MPETKCRNARWRLLKPSTAADTGKPPAVRVPGGSAQEGAAASALDPAASLLAEPSPTSVSAWSRTGFQSVVVSCAHWSSCIPVLLRRAGPHTIDRCGSSCKSPHVGRRRGFGVSARAGWTRRRVLSPRCPQGGSHSCGLRTDGTITCWGSLAFRTAAVGGARGRIGVPRMRVCTSLL